MLAEGGAIFVSIDDNEQHHLRMMMDEIFGGGEFCRKHCLAEALRLKRNRRISVRYARPRNLLRESN